MKRLFKVSKKEIEKGIARQFDACPLAWALPVRVETWVEKHSVTLLYSNRTITYTLGTELKQWIRNIDAEFGVREITIEMDKKRKHMEIVSYDSEKHYKARTNTDFAT